MTLSSQSFARAFRVDVQFHSGADTYAVETYGLLAIDAFDAERLARMRAVDSVYHNPRIPQLNLTVEVAGDEPPGPDGEPPPAAPGRLGAACPRCLSADIVRDAWARWDDDQQCWTLGGVHDFDTCQRCAAKGAGLILWLALPAASAGTIAIALKVEAYRAAVETMPDLAGRAFRLHCAEGLSYDEVAECLAISITQVEELLSRALATLVRWFLDTKY